jgi:hypothetical protein
MSRKQPALASQPLLIKLICAANDKSNYLKIGKLKAWLIEYSINYLRQA